ncbi:AAA family ATPase [Sporosarcina newyorkensis]|uniref:AAA domain (Cdc48 subfamily) n=1 Tax=Sporosarcina newyorkensis TaxID=759851 RepID=A0A1T4YI46_9BACL|nr:AAA family ATPase [Sporosarcina newyorkensis]SKB01340.1 AAA domain (Cdc48 subfamily) [Sporosarcina newyorkensis]
MKITVFYEPEKVFNERLNDSTRVLYFGDYIRGSDNERKDTQETVYWEKSYDVLVISSSELSGVNNHVMENVGRFINRITEVFGCGHVYINNPTKTTMKALENTFELELKDPYLFQNVSEEKVIRIKKEFDDFIIGQFSAKKVIIRNLLKLLIRTNEKPLVLMLYGNPGIGKTETAKFLAKQLDEGEIVREQMSMVHGEASLRYFKSTHHSEDSFSKVLINRTSNIILLDEFARSPEYIQDSFFQMFDEGIYEDNNYIVDVRKSIIICTSNFITEEEMKKNIDNALLSRFDALIKYEDFNNKEKELIIKRSIDQIKRTILKKYASMVDWKQLQGFLTNHVDGMTNMRHIKGIIEEAIAEEVLEKLQELR